MEKQILPMNLKRYLLMIPLTALLLAFTGWAGSAYGQATVMTDKMDYSPGETVIITGENWLPGESVELQIEHLTFDHATETFYTEALDDGTIYYSQYVIDPTDLGETFLLTATGQTSGLTADWMFTDSPKLSTLIVSAQVGSFTIGVGGSVTFLVTVTSLNNANFDAQLPYRTLLR